MSVPTHGIILQCIRSYCCWQMNVNTEEHMTTSNTRLIINFFSVTVARKLCYSPASPRLLLLIDKSKKNRHPGGCGLVAGSTQGRFMKSGAPRGCGLGWSVCSVPIESGNSAGKGGPGGCGLEVVICGYVSNKDRRFQGEWKSRSLFHGG